MTRNRHNNWTSQNIKQPRQSTFLQAEHVREWPCVKDSFTPQAFRLFNRTTIIVAIIYNVITIIILSPLLPKMDYITMIFMMNN
jgi:hypothetical protein